MRSTPAEVAAAARLFDLVHQQDARAGAALGGGEPVQTRRTGDMWPDELCNAMCCYTALYWGVVVILKT